MNLVAIGGGNKEPAVRVALERADNPSVLLIPSACSTEKSYDKKVPACVEFFRKFGIPEVAVLHDFAKTPTTAELDHKFGQATLAYIIGGNTPYLMQTLATHGSDKKIQKYAQSTGIVAGTSAGAIAQFVDGQSVPVGKPGEVQWQYEQISGLGLIAASVAVHADKHDPTPEGMHSASRFEYFTELDRYANNTGIALEEGTALAIFDNQPTIITAEPNKAVHILKKNLDGETVVYQNVDQAMLADSLKL